MSELDRLRHLGDQVVPPSFEVLSETARRGARRNALAASVVAAVAVAAVVAAGAAITSSDRTQEPIDKPTPRPTPTERLGNPAGQRTVLADIGPGDIGGYELVASRTNTQPGYEGATDLTMVGSELPWDESQFCHGDPDTWWVFIVDMGGTDGQQNADGSMQDGSRGSFGRCSQDDPTSPQPPGVELDPGRRYEPPQGYTLRMFVTGQLGEDDQRCLETTHAFGCPTTHGIEPLAETDAIFGFGDFEPRRTRIVMTLDGLVRYEALAIADGVEYFVDRAVIAADGADQLVVQLPESHGRRIVGIAQAETEELGRCADEVLGDGGADFITDAEFARLERRCWTELKLRVDGGAPALVEGYFSYVSEQSLVPAGDEHVVTVDVSKGDPDHVRYALVIWEERS